MNDIFKWIGSFFMHLIMWVFILSVRWDGRTMFSYANDILVQNALVQTLDEEMAEVWYRVSETAKVTFSQTDQEDQKKL
jgi:hypothetical protein